MPTQVPPKAKRKCTTNKKAVKKDPYAGNPKPLPRPTRGTCPGAGPSDSKKEKQTKKKAASGISAAKSRAKSAKADHSTLSAMDDLPVAARSKKRRGGSLTPLSPHKRVRQVSPGQGGNRKRIEPLTRPSYHEEEEVL